MKKILLVLLTVYCSLFSVPCSYAQWFNLNNKIGEGLCFVYFPDANTGYVVGSGVILKTTDAGTSWIKQNGGLGGLDAVYFTDINRGYAVGGFDDSIVQTTDGGNSWVPKKLHIL